MKTKNKLYRLLGSLSKEELRRFHLFLKSPYCNKSETMVSLFLYLRRFYPSFEHPKKLKKAVIYSVLKGVRVLDKNERHIQKYVVDRLSELTILLEEFLVIEGLKSNPEQMGDLLRGNLLTHRHFDLFIKKTVQAINILEPKEKGKDGKPKPNLSLSGGQYLKLWSLKYEPFRHPQTHNFVEKGSDLLETMEYLDDAYAILKLRYGLHQLSRKGILNGTKDVPLLDEIINRYSHTQNIVIRLYLTIISCFTKKDSGLQWKVAFDLLRTHLAELPFDEKLTYFTALINLGNRLAQKKSSDFFVRMFELYRLGFDEGIWSHGHIISSVTFMNIITLGATTVNQLSEKDASLQLNWLERFIKLSAPYLSGDEKENVLLYAKAQLAFAKGNFDEAYYEYLEKMELSDLANKIIYRMLRAKCLYELRNDNPNLEPVLSSFLESFYSFVRRTSLVPTRKRYYINFIKFLLVINSNHNRIRRGREYKNALRQRIEKHNRIAAYDWLCEKIEAL